MGALDRLHRSTPAELKARLAAERTGVPFIVLRDERDRQQIVELTPARSPLMVGRQPASDIALTWDDEVSRAHAAIECIGDVWTLVDDGRSRNGSFVNGQRVHGRRALRDGDVLAVGRTMLTYVAPEAQGEERTAPAQGRQGAPPISAAQRRVLVALCRPMADGGFAVPPSNRELAVALSLSVETIKFHLHALFEAFGLADVPQHQKRAALAQIALEQGVVSPHELRDSV
jgi:FHA domain